MMKRLFTAILTTGFLLTPVSAMAAKDPVHTSWRNNIAAGGMDVVTFFSGKPQEGKSEFSTRYQGADWHFFSQANKDLFLTNPEQFAPQYGGYCAWAVAQGKLAKGDPDHWAVEDGRLYFNYNSRIQKKWDQDRSNFIVNGDQNWPGLVSK